MKSALSTKAHSVPNKQRVAPAVIIQQPFQKEQGPREEQKPENTQ
jgi:hypothetical protein